MKNALFLMAWLCAAGSVFAQAPQGEVKDGAVIHTEASAKAVIAGATVALPASVTGAAPFAGVFRDLPARTIARVPVVVFLHGSSGLSLAAIAEWQQWLASQGVASIAPDSFGLPERLTYKSPVSKDVYEKIHALRASTAFHSVCVHGDNAHAVATAAAVRAGLLAAGHRLCSLPGLLD